MKSSIRFFSALLVSALVVAGVIAGSAVAQDKSKAKAEKSTSTVKVYFDNAKVRVFERSYKPGDTNTEVPSSFYRVNRTIQGGTLERTYADGKKEKIELKAGTVRFLEPTKGGATYTVKNIGNTEIVSFVIVLK